MNKLLVAVLSTLSLFANAQLIQKGIAVEMNSGKRPVSNVAVNVTGAQPTYSDNAGLFTLSIKNTTPGKKILVRDVNKTNYIITNKDEIFSRWVITIDADPWLHRIEIAHIDSIEAWKRQYKATAEANARKNYDQQVTQLKQELARTKISNFEYTKKIKELEENLSNANARSDELAERFAYINFDFALPFINDALKAYRNGDIDKASQLLDNIDIAGGLENSGRNVNQAEEQLAKYKEERRQWIEAAKTKADIFVTLIKPDSAYRYYEMAALADTSQFANLLSFAEFLLQQNRISQGMTWLQKARRHSSNDEENAKVLYNIGLAYYHLRDFKLSERYYLQVLEIRKKQVSQDSLKYLPDMALTMNNLGNVYGATSRNAEREEMYLKSFSIRQRLTKINPDKYLQDLANSYNNLGIIYKDKLDYNQAEQLYNQGLGLYKQMKNKENLSGYARTLTNIGSLHQEKKDTLQAEKNLKEALSIYQSFAELNREKYLPNVASCYFMLGRFYLSINEYLPAKENFTHSKIINEELSAIDSLIYTDHVFECLDNLAHICFVQKDFVTAKLIYKSLLEMLDNQSTSDTDHLAHTARIIDRLGKSANKLGELPASEQYFQRELDIYTRLTAENPEKYRKETADVYLELLVFYGDRRDTLKALNNYDRALEIYNILQDTNMIRICYSLMGAVYQEWQNYGEAINKYRKAISILEQMVISDSAFRFKGLVFLYQLIGSALSNQANYSEAEVAYNKSLEYSQKVIKEEPDFYVGALIDVGHVQLLKKDYLSSEKAYSKALESCNKYLPQGSESNQNRKARIFSGFGQLYDNLNNRDSTEKYYEKSIALYRKLVLLNSGDYMPALASICKSSANFHFGYMRIPADTIVSYYKTAIEYYNSTVKNYPEWGLYNLATTYPMLGAAYLFLLKDTINGINYYKIALDVSTKLVEINPDKYLSDLESILVLGFIEYHKPLHDTVSLKKEYSQIFGIRKKLAVKDPSNYVGKVIETALCADSLDSNMKNRRINGAYFGNVIAWCDSLSKTRNNTLKISIASSMVKEAESFYYKSDTLLAEVLFHKTAEIYSLSDLQSEDLNTGLASVYNYLGIINYDKKLFPAAEKYYTLALSYAERQNRKDSVCCDLNIIMILNNFGWLYKEFTNKTGEIRYKESGLIYVGKIVDRLKCCSDTMIINKYQKKSDELNDFFRNVNCDIIKAELLCFQGDSILINTGDSVKAYQCYEKAVGLVSGVVKIKRDPENIWTLSQIYEREVSCFDAKHNEKRIEIFEKTRDLRLEVYSTYKTETTIPAMAGCYSNLSCYYSFGKRFVQAEEMAGKGLEVDSSQTYIYTNYAVALLFQGKYEEAKKIYLELKDKEYPEDKTKTFKYFFLQDLDELEKAGITHPDVAKIRTLLTN
ncbi:MAG: tetratricopeptide repeat protein [Bacteroidetes bacterium]|nr:tetratricopeptide repeat protein [Bacteroidota bacterium]